MRHKKIQKRQTEPDKIFQNKLVTKFINNLMKDGKKTVAEKIFYQALEEIDKKGQKGIER